MADNPYRFRSADYVAKRHAELKEEITTAEIDLKGETNADEIRRLSERLEGTRAEFSDVFDEMMRRSLI